MLLDKENLKICLLWKNNWQSVGFCPENGKKFVFIIEQIFQKKNVN